MSTKPEATESLESINPDMLESVAGGATRVSGKGGGDAELTAMLTQIGSSIKDLAASKSSNSGGDTRRPVTATRTPAERSTPCRWTRRNWGKS